MSRDSLTLKIQGLDCVEEVTILKREIGPLVGGEAHLSFDVLKGEMTVLPTAVDHGLEAILRAVRKTGRCASPPTRGPISRLRIVTSSTQSRP